ncbi:hypothetical protein HaLaN_29229, partial [Haematococcus lacustris]
MAQWWRAPEQFRPAGSPAASQLGLAKQLVAGPWSSIAPQQPPPTSAQPSHTSGPTITC